MLPIAYVGWFILNNHGGFLGKDRPRGRTRMWCNLAMGLALLITLISVVFSLVKIGGPLKELLLKIF